MDKAGVRTHPHSAEIDRRFDYEFPKQVWNYQAQGPDTIRNFSGGLYAH
jgi:hypothetical protein